MNRQAHSKEREILVGNAICEFVTELRMVDVADYIAYLRLERLACIADLVDSAAELYFMPGTIKLGQGGEAHVDWGEKPRIVLDLELRPFGATVHFKLVMEEDFAGVEVHYINFDAPSDDPDTNTFHLGKMIEQTRIRKQQPLLAAS